MTIIYLDDPDIEPDRTWDPHDLSAPCWLCKYDQAMVDIERAAQNLADLGQGEQKIAELIDGVWTVTRLVVSDPRHSAAVRGDTWPTPS